MSSVSSMDDGKAEDKAVDLEAKAMPVKNEELDDDKTSPLTRIATTPPAPLTELDKGLIAWDSPRDPANPLYFPTHKRITNMVLICGLTFISPLGSSIFAPGVSYTLRDLNETSTAVGSLQNTIFLLGYSVGPLLLGPLSEIFGRYPIIIISTWCFNAFLLGCSFVQNMPGLIILRLLAGIGGSAVMNLAPAIVADVYPVERRSFAMATVLIVQSISPSAGPVCGGFIAQRLSWRWTYWILLIGSAVVTIPATFFFHECYAPAILAAKTKRLRKELGREDLHSKLALPVTRGELLKRSLIRPLKLLCLSPIAFFVSLFVATIYGELYLLMTTVTQVFVEQYGWSIELSGLTFIGFGCGMIIALILIMNTQDKTVAKLRAQNNGVFEPEMRLTNLIFIGGWVGPALLAYGWTCEYSVHWIAPVIALVFYGFGQVAIFMGTLTYVVDSYSQYAASAAAAVSCLRSLVGAFLPFAGPPLYEALGVGWGNTVLGLIAIALTPMILVFKRYGRTIRRKFPVEL